VLTPDLLNGYADRIGDFQVELVDGVGHWIVEQRPELVLDRLRSFLKDETQTIATLSARQVTRRRW